jgi:sugar phosphate isomerase/epimerase
VFELAARAGYDGLELMVDQRWETRQAEYLRNLIQRSTLPVLSVHSSFVPDVAGKHEA